MRAAQKRLSLCFLAGFVSCTAASCSEERASLVLTINPVPSNAKKVVVDIKLNGQQLSVEPFENNLPVGNMTMGFMLPVGESGTIALNVHVKGDGPCDIATAATELTAAELTRSDVSLTLLPRKQAPKTTQSLYAVWGSSSTDIWVGGQDGIIYNGDGSCWYDQGPGLPVTVRSISGTSREDVWAVGNSNAIIHWNGTAWGPSSIMGTIPLGDLTGVHAISRSAVYAVGTTSVPPYRLYVGLTNGLNWTDKQSEFKTGTIPGNGAFKDIWGTASTDLLIAGDIVDNILNPGFGVFIKKDDNWNMPPSSGTRIGPTIPVNRTSVWGTSKNDIWIGSASVSSGSPSVSVVNYNGSGYVGYFLAGTQSPDKVTAIWTGGNGDVWLSMSSPNAAIPKVLRKTSQSTTFSGVQIPNFPSNGEINDIWGSGPNDVWLVGTGGLRVHYDGTTFTFTE